MSEHDRRKDNRTISHNLDDRLGATIRERVAADQAGDATRPTPRAPERVGEVGNTDAPVAPDEGPPPAARE